jgi:AcrR family transcriptional regulator
MSTTEDVPISSTSAEQHPRPMRKDAARNRELLIAAGRDVFAKRGLEASLDEIARHAGVGIGTAYRHFANKFELAEAIMGEAIGNVVAAAERALEVDNPWDGLVGFLEDVLEVQTQDRGLREVMMGVRNPHKSDEVYERLSQPILSILERAQDAGSVRAELSVTDLGCMLAMLCEVADLGSDTAPDLWRRYSGILLAGLRPDGPELPGAPLSEQEFRAASERRHALRVRQTTN